MATAALISVAAGADEVLLERCEGASRWGLDPGYDERFRWWADHAVHMACELAPDVGNIGGLG